MTVAMTVAPSSPELLDAQLTFHLNVGVDLVIAPAGDASEAVREIVDRYARDGHVVRSRVDAETLAEIDVAARLAATEYGADWLVASHPTEFWWPRGAQLGDVLVAVPPRYGVVQALVREFVPRAGREPFAERMTVRDSLAEASAGDEPLLHLLRPIRRLEPSVGLHGGQPLRAWYPVEVLRFPDTTRGSLPDGAEDEDVARGLEDGSLVVDERLRDALRTLRDGPPSLPVPTVVDDALYAVECAAVGEVNLDRLDRQIRDLEDRLAWLERRPWPRLLRSGSRFVPSRIRRRG